MRYEAADFWAAIDAAVGRSGLSHCAVAKRAGLSNNALSPGKVKSRVSNPYRTKNPGPSWPGMYTVAAVLTATRTTPEQWAADVEAARFNRELRELRLGELSAAA